MLRLTGVRSRRQFDKTFRGASIQQCNPQQCHARYLTSVDLPVRKQLNAQLKAKRKAGKTRNNIDSDWELTVGIEIHAQLNAGKKLFSGKNKASLVFLF
jgi:hypothetical protein